MRYFAGLDVGVKTSALCVCEEKGKPVREVVLDSSPDAIAGACAGFVLERLCLEAGGLADWLALGLRRAGIKAVVVEARQARSAAEAMPAKTDRNDARVLAHIARTGWYSEVHVKSLEAQGARSLLVAREALVKTCKANEACIRGLLRRFGVKLGKVSDARFEAKVREKLELLPEPARPGLELLLAGACEARRRADTLRRQIARIAARHGTLKRLMSLPGVGPLTAYAFMATIDVPERFGNARKVGSYLGLAPVRHQSGESDRMLKTSKAGDRLLRCYLYEAATSLMSRGPEACRLKAWGLALARRRGRRRACVGLARKLAVILKAIWSDGTWYEEKSGCAKAA